MSEVSRHPSHSDTDVDHMASEATTIAFIKTVETLCDEGYVSQRFGMSCRELTRDGKASIYLGTSPDDTYSFWFNEVEHGLVSARNIISERKILKPESLPLGIYAVKHSVFVDHREEKAKVQRVTRPILTLGRYVTTAEIRDASEREVIEARDIIIEAAAHEAMSGITTPEDLA